MTEVYELAAGTPRDGERMECRKCHRLLHQMHNKGENQLYWQVSSREIWPMVEDTTNLPFVPGEEYLYPQGYECTICTPNQP